MWSFVQEKITTRIPPSSLVLSSFQASIVCQFPSGLQDHPGCPTLCHLCSILEEEELSWATQLIHCDMQSQKELITFQVNLCFCIGPHSQPCWVACSPWVAGWTPWQTPVLEQPLESPTIIYMFSSSPFLQREGPLSSIGLNVLL